MATVRSRMARRGRTGRKPATKTHVKRAVKVHKHHHRRYAGVKGGHPSKPRARVSRRLKANKTGHHRRFLGRHKRGLGTHRLRKGRHGHRHFKGRHLKHKRHVRPGQHHRKGLHRKFKGRRHTSHRHGLHRKFKGRHYHGRHVKPGQHRRFFGRKTTHHRGHIRAPKPKPQPISAASYLSMF